MAFDITMNKNQYNLKKFHKLVRELPVTFTFKEAEKLFGDETEEVLRKAQKLLMIGKKTRYNKTSYFIRDLYCMHYKKGKYAV